MADDIIEQITEITGIVLACGIGITAIAIGGALGLCIGKLILVEFGVL